jgi:hypothetical protein
MDQATGQMLQAVTAGVSTTMGLSDSSPQHASAAGDYGKSFEVAGNAYSGAWAQLDEASNDATPDVDTMKQSIEQGIQVVKAAHTTTAARIRRS